MLKKILTFILKKKKKKNFFSIGKTNENAAWYYPKPKDAAKNIQGYVAFWKGVIVTK